LPETAEPNSTNSFQQPQAAIVVQPAALTAIGSYASLMSVRVQPVSLAGFQPPPTAAVRQRCATFGTPVSIRMPPREEKQSNTGGHHGETAIVTEWKWNGTL